MNIQTRNTLFGLYWYERDELEGQTIPNILKKAGVGAPYVTNSSHQNLSEMVTDPPNSCPESYFFDPEEACDYRAEDNPKKETIDQIKRFKFLEPGWDGYDGVTPSMNAVEDTITLVKALPDNFPLPKPMVSGDGEVGLYWKQENIFIDLEFSGNSFVTYYARAANGKEYFGEDVEFSYNEIPHDITETLKTLI